MIDPIHCEVFPEKTRGPPGIRIRFSPPFDLNFDSSNQAFKSIRLHFCKNKAIQSHVKNTNSRGKRKKTLCLKEMDIAGRAERMKMDMDLSQKFYFINENMLNTCGDLIPLGDGQ